jgi:hypothetical protein
VGVVVDTNIISRIRLVLFVAVDSVILVIIVNSNDFEIFEGYDEQTLIQPIWNWQEMRL